MKNTLRYFMWGYQSHFQVLAQRSAEEALSRLSSKYKPNLFLVGALVEERENRLPICVEPEDCGHDISLFSDLLKQTSHLMAVDPEREFVHSWPIAQEHHNQKLKLNAFRNAVIQSLHWAQFHEGKQVYCSWPVRVEGYLVCIVIEINRIDLESMYSLRKNLYQSRYRVPTSLLEATVVALFSALESTLSKPDPGAGLDVLEREYDDVIRHGGRLLMNTVAWAVEKPVGGGSLFEACNSISSMRYEGADGVGQMIIGPSGHPNIECNLRLLVPVKIYEYRAIRKLLEVTSDDNLLLCDGEFVYGFGQQVSLYDHSRENLFVVNFLKHYSWQLSHAEHVLMKVDYRDPGLPKLRINEAKFRKDVPRIFSGIDDKSLTNLWKIILEATKQKHGTMVVVTNDAESEAKRLRLQSTLIEPVTLKPEVMKTVTSIDGAVLIDPKTVCYAIGVILDGLASEKGSPSRGARYNSAVRYVEGKQECLAVIVSEDGSIDLVPDLMPQITRNLIASKLDELKQLLHIEESEFEVKKFNQLMDWFTRHEFYLSRENCDEINSLNHLLNQRIDPQVVKIMHRDLSPNKAMDESYFVK